VFFAFHFKIRCESRYNTLNFFPCGAIAKESRQTEDIKSRRKSRCAVLGYIYLKIDVNSGIIPQKFSPAGHFIKRSRQTEYTF
jgi:hypothetical protein